MAVRTRQVTSATRAPGSRKIRVTVKRVGPWSVLKFSLIFYFCLSIVIILGTFMLLTVLRAVGLLGTIEELIADVGFAGFRFDLGLLFRTMFLIAFITTVVGAAFTACVALLYNLISDLVGGIDVTLTERR